MTNKTHSPLTQSERMEQFRLKIIGSLLASPPDKRDLRNQLSQLTQKPWLHPISGESVHYSLPTLERWYYKAIKEPQNLLKILSTQQRNDKGAFKSLNPSVCDALIQQYAEHDGWSVQLHYDNLRVLKGRTPIDCYLQHHDVGRDCPDTVLSHKIFPPVFSGIPSIRDLDPVINQSFTIN